MRLRQQNLKTVYLKKRKVNQDKEANDELLYHQAGKPLQLTIQDGAGLLATQLYGERLTRIKIGHYQGTDLNQHHNEGDGICLSVGPNKTPDYKIIAIKNYSTHKAITLEWLGVEKNGG